MTATTPPLLASGSLLDAGSGLRPAGTTGTGLDGILSILGADAGLNLRLPGSALSAGMSAADGLNLLIVQARARDRGRAPMG